MEIIAENVDKLITLEMRPQVHPVRGITSRLYAFAREKQGGKPLTLLAAQDILERVKKNDNVILITNTACSPFLPHGETDGPLGIASLARAMNLGLGARPLFLVGRDSIGPVKSTANAAGFNVEGYDVLVSRESGVGTIIPFPYDGDEEEEKTAKEIISQYEPKALISVEALGPNRKGIVHSMYGFGITKIPGLYHLFDEARRKGILTIGCIDGGNELGSGTIAEEVRRICPYGKLCQCPCKSGNACVTEADVVIPTTTSNWGAYGTSAMLAFLLGKPYLLQDTDMEHRMLEQCIMAGGVDGRSLTPIMAVDGMSARANECVVSILHEIVETGLLKELKRGKVF